jgi:hypothetical protein
MGTSCCVTDQRQPERALRTRRVPSGWRRVVGAALVAAVAGGLSPRAEATWSIVLVDTRTGEVAVGSATCLTNFDLRFNTPVLLTGVGGATAQSSVDTGGFNRGTIRNLMARGATPESVLARLAATDTLHQSRQYGYVDTLGRPMTFTGTGANEWAGGEVSPIVGRVGDIAYAVQGNLLTGACVVAEAVSVVLGTPGDLPDKLMRSMEAARLAGGDARCSCAPEAPPGCGCPPENMPARKSAHIGYMLVARAGDRDASHTLARGSWSGPAIGGFVPGGNGLAEIVAISGSPPVASVFPNLTVDFADRPSPPMVPFPGFGDALNTTLPTGDYSITLAADLTGDGLADLAACNATTSTLSVLPGRAGLPLGPRTDYALGSVPRAIAAGDLFGSGRPDLIVSLSTPGLRIMRNIVGAGGVGGTLEPGALLALPGPSSSVTITDLTGDGTPDVLAVVGSQNRVVSWSNNGAGVLAPRADLTVGTSPNSAAVTDFNADGRPDIVVSNSGVRTLRMYVQQPDGTYTLATLTLAANITRLLPAELNGDGRPDVVAVHSDRITPLINTGSGLSALPVSQAWPGTSVLSVAAGDLNGDGKADLLVPTGAGLQVMTNRGDGTFGGGSGFAAGEYFLALNVANQSATAVDPVVQMRTQYDAWRAGLPGRVDAVSSTVALGAGGECLIAAPGETLTLTIDPRDIAGARAVGPFSVRVAHAAGSARRSSVLSSGMNPDGTVFVTLGNAAEPGTDRLAITLDDGVRPVTLMPYAKVRVNNSVDYNRDGLVTLDDLGDYLTDFFIRPEIPAGVQPAAPTYPGVLVGYVTPCGLAGDAPPPYAVDAYRTLGFRVGYSAGGDPSTACPPFGMNLDTLGDFITAFYNPPSRCFNGWGE